MTRSATRHDLRVPVSTPFSGRTAGRVDRLVSSRAQLLKPKHRDSALWLLSTPPVRPTTAAHHGDWPRHLRYARCAAPHTAAPTGACMSAPRIMHAHEDTRAGAGSWAGQPRLESSDAGSARREGTRAGQQQQGPRRARQLPRVTRAPRRDLGSGPATPITLLACIRIRRCDNGIKAEQRIRDTGRIRKFCIPRRCTLPCSCNRPRATELAVARLRGSPPWLRCCSVVTAQLYPARLACISGCCRVSASGRSGVASV